MTFEVAPMISKYPGDSQTARQATKLRVVWNVDEGQYPRCNPGAWRRRTEACQTGPGLRTFAGAVWGARAFCDAAISDWPGRKFLFSLASGILGMLFSVDRWR